MYATSADIPPVNDLIPTHECERCFRKNKSYLDSLKHELNKRIEYEAIKGIKLLVIMKIFLIFNKKYILRCTIFIISIVFRLSI